ncbi:MAG: dihydrolipoyl dehydrogenase [Zetaproteobacteria bacterium]|nr:dihydrolipoyl dehydrogenase [Pseudobdellovibrionaceae bacterium]|tara:strand:- start:39 stop:1436 length:1398 start_codon:yes stop_codon:yes gene_type:complete
MNAENFEFDVIVIGSGPGGYVCAIRCAQNGLKTACVEQDKTLGGTCLNVGCIPSKALLESSHKYHSIKHEAKDHGIKIKEAQFDLNQMMQRKSKIVTNMNNGVTYLFKKNNIKTLIGKASFADKNKIIVNNKEYTAKNFVIASGSLPIEIPCAKFDHNIIVDSTDALGFEEVPKKLIVVGAGAIGLELGSVWSRLGSEVTVIEAMDTILPGVDRDVSDRLRKILEKQGVTFRLSCSVTSSKVTPKGGSVSCLENNEELTFTGDKILVAVGRKPFTEGLGIEKIELDQDKKTKAIIVNEKWQTSQNHIYAIGDVIKGPMLAHKASEEGMAVADAIADKYAHVNYRAIPNIIYTWPEVACLGLNEQECKQQNIDYKIGKFLFKANGRAQAMGETDGLIKIISDKKSDKIVGFHILGASASELIGEAVVAFEYGASSEDLARSVHAHPTLSEVIKEAALSVYSQAIHS